MVRKKDRRKLIIAAAVIGVIVIAIATAALIKAFSPEKSNPYVVNDESSQTSSTSDESTNDSNSTNNETPATPNGDGTTTEDAEDQPAPDPATVSTIDIEPMKLAVSYVKGAGGFEYEVLRTPNGSQYVEFRSAELVGTKCTDDQGTFVSILENPSTGEGSSITKSTTVDGTKYGLSLAAANCTSDAAKLQKYQKSFNDAFGLLKKLD